MAVSTSTARSPQIEPRATQFHVLPDITPAATIPHQDELQAWFAAAEIDLADPSSLALLMQLDRFWRQMLPEAHHVCLRDKQFVISTPLPDASDIVVLPGGIVALRAPEGVLVADPLSNVTFATGETKRLKAALRDRKSAMTLVHTVDGITAQPGLPTVLAPQSISIVADASRLPKLAGVTGPTLIQWCAGGAVAWPMRTAPSAIALAARAVGILVVPDEAALPPEQWSATDPASRTDLIAVGLAELVNDLLADEVCDELRYAILSRCIEGNGSLASRIAEILGAIPACFLPDAAQSPGAAPNAWRNGAALLQDAGPDHMLLGLQCGSDAHRIIAALREVLADPTTALFLELGTDSRCTTVSVDSDAAMFLVRRAGAHGRIGLIVPCGEDGPTDLYALASRLATEADAGVTIAAPCYGFSHRLCRSGEEFGNAAWFGMGAGLDELEILAACQS